MSKYCFVWYRISKILGNGVTRVGVTRAATDGVTPIFSKTDDLFCSSLPLFYFTRVSPTWRVSSRIFFTCPTSFPRCSLWIQPQIFFIRVSPPWKVSPGAVRPLVTPLILGRNFAIFWHAEITAQCCTTPIVKRADQFSLKKLREKRGSASITHNAKIFRYIFVAYHGSSSVLSTAFSPKATTLSEMTQGEGNYVSYSN